MKNFSYSLATLLLFSFSSNLLSQKPVEKTLIKSFNLHGYKTLDLFLNGNVELKEWDSPIVRVEMAISLLHGNHNTLNSLVKAGKYDLFSEEVNTSYRISMVGFSQDFDMPGTNLEEKVTYTISVPRYLEVRTINNNLTVSK